MQIRPCRVTGRVLHCARGYSLSRGMVNKGNLVTNVTKVKTVRQEVALDSLYIDEMRKRGLD